MAANSYPALNDVMHSELVILTESVADLCPEIKYVRLTLTLLKNQSVNSFMRQLRSFVKYSFYHPKFMSSPRRVICSIYSHTQYFIFYFLIDINCHNSLNTKRG